MAFYDITPLKLGQAAATTNATTLYTTPVDTRTFVKDIDIVNTSATPLTFDIYFVPVAGTAGTDNALFYQQIINPKQNIQWCGSQILNAGETIQIKASASGINIFASGGEAV